MLLWVLLPFCIRVWDYPNKQKRTRPGRSRIWLFSGSVATLPMLATIAFPPFSVLLSKRFQETKRPPETSVYDYLRNTSLKRKQPAKCQNRFISALRHTFNFHHPTMRLHNLLYKQKPQPMPQVQPFIGAFHVMRFFFQLSQFFSGHTYTIVRNYDRNFFRWTIKGQENIASLRIVVDAVLHQVTDSPRNQTGVTVYNCGFRFGRNFNLDRMFLTDTCIEQIRCIGAQ